MLDITDQTDLQTFLDSRLQALVAEANQAGFGTERVLAGLTQAAQRLQFAYGEDPDPADDPDLETGRAAKVAVPDDGPQDLDTERGVPRAG